MITIQWEKAYKSYAARCNSIHLAPLRSLPSPRLSSLLNWFVPHDDVSKIRRECRRRRRLAAASKEKSRSSRAAREALAARSLWRSLVKARRWLLPICSPATRPMH